MCVSCRARVMRLSKKGGEKQPSKRVAKGLKVLKSKDTGRLMGGQGFATGSERTTDWISDPLLAQDLHPDSGLSRSSCLSYDQSVRGKCVSRCLCLFVCVLDHVSIV